MKQRLAAAILSSVILLQITVANAEVRAKETNINDVAINFLVEILINKTDPDLLSCDQELDKIAKSILSQPANLKALKLLGKARRSKDAKSLLKLLGISEASFRAAAAAVAQTICDDDGSDDEIDDDNGLGDLS